MVQSGDLSGSTPHTPTPQTIQGILSAGSLVGGMLSGGMRRVIVDAHQTTDSLFVHGHMRDTVLILEEGNHPHTRCHSCNIFPLCAAMNNCRPKTALCEWGEDRKRQQPEKEEAWAEAEEAF